MRLAALVPLALAGALLAQPPAPDRTLANGWKLRPAGRQVPLGRLPLSTTLSPDGKFLLVLNCRVGEASISVVDVAAEREVSRTPVADAWLGLAFSPKGDRVYVGGGAEAAVFEFSFAAGKLTPARTFPLVAREKRTAQDFIGDVAFDSAGRLLYVAELFHNSIAVINPQSGMVIERIRTGRRPYRILLPPDFPYFFVSSWADGTVYQHDLAKGAVMARLRVGAHPTDMLWLPGRPTGEPETEPSPTTARLFVATANTNNVVALGAAGGDLRELDVMNLSLTPWQPVGMTPSALTLSPDGKRLYIACSDANAIAAADVSAERAAPLGFIPTGRYPTAVRALAKGRIVAVNGGDGSASFIDAPDEAAFGDYSQVALENTPYRDQFLENAGVGPNSPIPAHPGVSGPIQRVIYILTGGAAAQGANHRKLAREFAALEDFSPIGTGPADGLQWALAGVASDFVAKMQPRPFRYAGEPAAFPPSAYLWTHAAAAEIPFRNYGFPAENDPTLQRSTNPQFRGAASVKAFLAELAEFEKSGQAPALMLVRLANDQDKGASAAEQDAALGAIVEAVSHSKLWPGAAIFIAPERADRPGDRGAALVVSPYARRGAADRTPCNTASMLRTIELILGLRPMTVFDAGARPLTGALRNTPDLAPYTAATR